MKKFFVINLIVQIINSILAWIYCDYIATGWDGLWVIIAWIVAVPIVAIDIIGLVVIFVKNRKKKKKEEDIQESGLEYFVEEQKDKEKQKKNKIKLALKIILGIILTIPTLFISISTLWYMYDGCFDPEYVKELERVDYKTENEMVRYAKKKYGNVKLLNSVEVPIFILYDEYDEVIDIFDNRDDIDDYLENNDDCYEDIKEKKSNNKKYIFEHEEYGFEFEITEEISYSNGRGSMFNDGVVGYRTYINSTYHDKYSEYVDFEFTRILGEKYNDKIITIDSVNEIGKGLVVNVIVDVFADDASIEYAEGKLKEIAEESRIVIRKVDRDKSFGREQGFGIVRYYIDVELDRSWAVREDFRQYDVIGKYYSETDEYKKARKDWDGITLPEDEW